MALLGVLAALRPQFSWTLTAAYIDHGLRPEAAAEGEHVRQTAAELGVAAVARRLPGDLHSLKGDSLQALARRERYMMLLAIAGECGAEFIATGHTADDQAETVLMRILRGTGFQGLGAIKYINGPIRRPLLDARREETEAYCRISRLSPVLDKSNLKDDYLRNRLRHRLMPMLAEINTNYVTALCRLAETAQVENAWLEQLTMDAAGRIGMREDGGWWCRSRDFAALPTALKRRVLRWLIAAAGDGGDGGDACNDDWWPWARMGESESTYEHIVKLEELLSAGRTGAALHLPGGLTACLEKGGFWIGRTTTTEYYEVTPPLPGVMAIPYTLLTLSLKLVEGTQDALSEIQRSGRRPPGQPGSRLEEHEPVPWRPEEKCEYLDWEAIAGLIKLRNRRPGDCYQPMGMSGRKKVQDILVDLGIPRRWRDRLPVLADDDGIIWMAGVRGAERVKVTPATRVMLEIRLQVLHKP